MSPHPRYYIILDFEATCNAYPLAVPCPQEIIEFPSVVLDTTTMQFVDEFSSYVRPIHHPTLSAFCTKLTGITQETVDAAQPFGKVLATYLLWLQKYSNNYMFVTCGNWDFRSMLPSQCATSNIELPTQFGRWINMKKEFQLFYNKCAAHLPDALHHVGLELQGRHHSGIDDCRNIASIWRIMIIQGWRGVGASPNSANAKFGS